MRKLNKVYIESNNTVESYKTCKCVFSYYCKNKKVDASVKQRVKRFVTVKSSKR